MQDDVNTFGCLALLLAWILVGLTVSFGIFILIFGSLVWGVGFILIGIFVAVASFVANYLLARPRRR